MTDMHKKSEKEIARLNSQIAIKESLIQQEMNKY